MLGLVFLVLLLAANRPRHHHRTELIRSRTLATRCPPLPGLHHHNHNVEFSIVSKEINIS
jgi:hypothetical protein